MTSTFKIKFIIKINKEGKFEDCFNGPGHIIWDAFINKKMPGNG